jgi:hypothetical protein
MTYDPYDHNDRSMMVMLFVLLVVWLLVVSL